ncbi:signal peptidase II [Oceaniglobus ichthyenteri]|uniref:signal peptidase II n=1 Tax=Oceaniglobus ichthyenteri TaxID=2136177 RepID=UPI000D355C9E|nr:signal peptidase II [Oceaniglobus ichthyenteri]
MGMMFKTAGFVFILDQISKYVVVHMMNLASVGEIDVWPPYLNLRMAWNRGVNFGLFASDVNIMRWVLIAVALAITVWVIWWMRAERPGRWGMISAGLLIGGALGNVVDRLFYGAVADFLNMSCCGIENPYAFNVADISIFIGAVGLVLFTGNGKKRKSARAR